jgi:hypothetical protein
MDERRTDDPVGEASQPGVAPETRSFPEVERRFDPVPDLDDRLRRIYARLMLPPPPFE